MKIAEINKVLADPKMQNKNTNFKIVDNGRKPTISDVLREMKAMEHRIMSRIDNLVAKNKLKE